MILKILLLLSATVILSVSDSILLVVDNAQVLQSHSRFINMLKQTHSLQIAYVFGKTKIELKNYDRFRYDHVVIMGLSFKESASQIKANDIVSYFDDGGDLIIIGDIDTDRSFRKLFYAFGVQIDQYGSKLKDYFSHHQNIDRIKTSNYVESPFLNIKKPLVYQGVGLNMVNYENYQLYPLISSQSTTLSRNYIKQQTQQIGRKILAVGVQGLNNARAILIGSQYFFSDAAFEFPDFDNQNAVKDLLLWTFRKTGVLRASDMQYHGEGAQSKETLFNVGQKIFFNVSVQIKKSDYQHWQPYSTKDLQVQFVMLDPWVRAPLTQVSGTSRYSAQFFAPQKQGIYQFKLIYKKPGYTFLTYTERVTLRPYKHDEYERFLLVAFPYEFGMVATILGTFLFVIIYLYSGFTFKVKQD